MDEIPEPSSRGRKRLRDQEDTELQCSDLDQTLSLGKLYIYIYILKILNLKYFNFVQAITIIFVSLMQRKIFHLAIHWWRCA